MVCHRGNRDDSGVWRVLHRRYGNGARYRWLRIVTDRAETVEEARDRTARALAFDGMFRPEVWDGLHSWHAVSYVNEGRMGTRTAAINPATGDKVFPTEEAARAACAEQNKGRSPIRRRPTDDYAMAQRLL